MPRRPRCFIGPVRTEAVLHCGVGTVQQVLRRQDAAVTNKRLVLEERRGKSEDVDECEQPERHDAGDPVAAAKTQCHGARRRDHRPGRSNSCTKAQRYTRQNPRRPAMLGQSPGSRTQELLRLKEVRAQLATRVAAPVQRQQRLQMPLQV